MKRESESGYGPKCEKAKGIGKRRAAARRRPQSARAESDVQPDLFEVMA